MATSEGQGRRLGSILLRIRAPPVIPASGPGAEIQVTGAIDATWAEAVAAGRLLLRDGRQSLTFEV